MTYFVAERGPLTITALATTLTTEMIDLYKTFLLDGSANNVSVTLPPATPSTSSPRPGQKVKFVVLDGTNTTEVLPGAGTTVLGGAGAKDLAATNDSVTLQYNAATLDWVRIGEFPT